MKEYIEYVSIGLSVSALVVTLIVYFAHDRRIKKQEAKLNAYQLKKIEEDGVSEKKAEMRANIISGDRGIRIVKIYNKGRGKATNVRLLMDDKGFLIRNKAFPKAFINPQESAEFHVHLTESAPDSLLLTVLWDDANSTENQYQQILDV